MDRQVIIFSHYGYSDYLNYTLACARKTNPNARLIFLGDEENKKIAEKFGWNFFYFNEYKSSLNQKFNTVFKHVQGKKHNPIKNNKDWLRYVFERWFFIESFVSKFNIERFWHFDSDTMIISDLSPIEKLLCDFEFTVQCNNTCLNGIMNKSVVTEYCNYICKLFENSDFIMKQQHEFDTIHPDFAFTEMRAFDDYKNKSELKWANLMLFSDKYVFDDCICQDHGFKMISLLNGQFVKYIESENGKFFGYRDGQKLEFITLNLSWVPIYMFRWVFVCLNSKNLQSLKSVHLTLSEALFDLRARLVKSIRNVIL